MEPPVDTAGPSPAWLDRTAYPFENRWLAVPGGNRMHYIDEGQGEALLFVHGTPSWSFEWRHLVRGLSSAYRCIAPDLLGFGLSERPADFPYTPEAHAEALAAFVDRLGLDGFTLVVHDYGGPIGLPLCLDAPARVRRLVLLNTWMWSLAGDRTMERGARLMSGRIGRWLYRRANFSLRVLLPSAYADRSRLTPEVHRQYLAPFAGPHAREQVLWPLARALLGSSAYYEHLWQRRDRLRGRPALILWGVEDRLLRPHLLERWRETLPQARVVELPVGHWPHEEAPDRVVDELRAFMDDVGRATPGAAVQPSAR